MKRKQQWFVAHLIVYTKFKKGTQHTFPAWENIHLIRAADPKTALAKAKQIGKDSEGDDKGSFSWGGKPAIRIFGGVRKLISLWENPADGMEVGYLELKLGGRVALKRLIAGKSVKVLSLVGKDQHPT